jgi:hypothetical protein
MAKASSSQFSVFLVDGMSLLAAKVQGVTHEIKALYEAATGLGDGWGASLPTGRQQATLAQSGAFFDDVTNGFHLAFANQLTLLRNVVFAWAGNVAGARFTGFAGTYGSDYAPQPVLNGLSKANVSYLISGECDRGLIVQPWIQQVGTWTSASIDNAADTTLPTVAITSNSLANPSVVFAPNHGLISGDVALVAGVTGSTPSINGQQVVTFVDLNHVSVPVNVTIAGTGGTLQRLNSDNGGWGFLHLSELTGPSNIAVVINHSSDNASWSALVTFAGMTAAPGAQRVAVAPGTVVKRYLQVVGTFTGAGTCTPFVGFSRS